MSDGFSQEAVSTVLIRLGHEIVAEKLGQVVYRDLGTGHHLTVVFVDGSIEWADLARIFDNEGVNVSVFLAEHESL